jgi:hypothetical protein
MGLGRFIGEKLHNLRTIGLKVAHGVRVAGNKLGGWMLSAAAFDPALGAGIASAGAIARGIGKIAGGVEGVLG